LEVIVLFKAFSCTRPVVILACLAAVFVLSLSCAFATDAARLESATCSPSAGTTSTVFRYSVVYYGPVEPSAHDVHIDNFGTSTIYSMRKVGTGPSGTGSLYVYETRLAPGNHQYRFRFAAGAAVLRKPGPTGENWYAGPTVTAATEKYTISGVIKANDVALSGVEVHLTRAGSPMITFKTNAEGRYTAGGLVAGTYLVTPTRAGYRMDPLSKTVTVPASTTTCNFRAIKR
jgi:hypothetical protein